LLPRKILVGTDFTSPSKAALDWAAGFGQALGADLLVAHVYDLPIVSILDGTLVVDAQTAARLSTEAQSALDAEIQRMNAQSVAVQGLLRQGDARVALPQLAVELGADLLVVGSHGRRGIKHALLGSVAEHVVRASTVPVLVVKASG